MFESLKLTLRWGFGCLCLVWFISALFHTFLKKIRLCVLLKGYSAALTACTVSQRPDSSCPDFLLLEVLSRPLWLSLPVISQCFKRITVGPSTRKLVAVLQPAPYFSFLNKNIPHTHTHTLFPSSILSSLQAACVWQRRDGGPAAVSQRRGDDILGAGQCERRQRKHYADIDTRVIKQLFGIYLFEFIYRDESQSATLTFNAFIYFLFFLFLFFLLLFFFFFFFFFFYRWQTKALWQRRSLRSSWVSLFFSPKKGTLWISLFRTVCVHITGWLLISG